VELRKDRPKIMKAVRLLCAYQKKQTLGKRRLRQLIKKRFGCEKIQRFGIDAGMLRLYRKSSR